jgi:PTS system nitrogen regulatory IIA component
MDLFKSAKKKKSAAQPSAPAPEEAKPEVVRVSDYLSEKNIAFFPAGPSKRQVFGHLIGSLDLADPNAALTAILAREEAGTTVIAPGLAIPHARMSGLGGLRAALGLCPSGVEDPKAEGGPIRVFLLFLGPAENMRLHLAFLASVSAVFQSEGLMDALLQLHTPQSVLEIIRDAEKNLQ